MALLTLLAALAVSASAQNSTSVEIVTRLLDQNPGDLLDLETILGPLNRDATGRDSFLDLRRTRDSGPIEEIAVGFDIDIYHNDPRRPNPELGSWALTFREGREELLELLEIRFGPPTLVGDKRRFGRLFFHSGGDDRCSLEWYRSEPEWAKATRSEAETTALQRNLVLLLSAEGLLSGDQVSLSAIEDIFGPLEPDPGWKNCDRIVQPTWKLTACQADAERPAKLTVSFDHDRPLPATEELLRALGFTTPPAVVSTDVHMTTRVLVESATLGRSSIEESWVEVFVALDGLVHTERYYPGSAVWQTTPPIMVLSIQIETLSARTRHLVRRRTPPLPLPP